MARNKRWTIPFKSLNGTNCRIDIYDEGWSGAVTELSTANANAPGVAAADPFYYEEDNDESLLEVIRYRTGYINLIETVYGGLADLYPETDTEHYVEFYYGTTLDFTGYIQAQSFENQWAPAPRTVSLPVISPLGLLAGLNFTQKNPPGEISLGAALKEVIDGLNAAYTSVIYPYGGASGESYYSLNDKISTLILSPFNDDFNKHSGTDNDVFTTETYKFFVEGLCNLFGWVVHDTPDAVVFTEFHYDYRYKSCPVTALATLEGEEYITTPTGGTVVSITDYFSYADNDAKESVVRPYKELVWQYDGDVIKDCNFPYERMVLSTIDDTYTIKVAELRPCGPELSGMVIPGYVTSAGKTQSGVSPCVVGSNTNDLSECLTFTVPNGGYSANTEMFTWNIYEHPEGAFYIDIQMSWGDDINHTDNQDGTSIMFGIEVTGGSVSSSHLLINDDSGKGRISISNVPHRGAVSVKLKHVANNGLVVGRVYRFDEIIVKENADAFHEYLNNTTKEDVVNENNGSIETANIPMPFSYSHDNSNLVGDEVTNVLPYYRYLIKTQNRIEAMFKRTASFSLPYIPKWQLWINSWRWRMVAIAFYPWDDKYRLTMHRSSTIE